MISENSCLLPNDTCITKSLQRPEERFGFFLSPPRRPFASTTWLQEAEVFTSATTVEICYSVFLELILLKISYHAAKPSDTKKRKHCLVAAKLRCKTRWETALGETRLDILAGRPIKSSCI